MGRNYIHPSELARKQATDEGVATYNGTQCKRCGTTEKYLSGWNCVHCVKQKTLKRNSEIYRKYSQTDKGRRNLRNGVLKRKYNITIEQYEEMFIQQNKCCVICNETIAKFVVDHCHTSQKVRSILCDRCNKVLGLVREKEEVLKQMIKYIKVHHA